LAWSLRQGHPRLVAIVSTITVLAASFAFASMKLYGGTAMAATPTLSTAASADTEIGLQIFDNANLQGGAAPTGTITFTLYGPGDTTCATSIFSPTVPVNGTGSYNSTPFTTSQAGTYQWRAAYSGDANNTPATTVCNDPAESVIVAKASTVLTTTASGPIAIGGTISDTAHLNGGFGPTGTISFELHGPTDTICSGTPVFNSTATVNGNGDYVSGSYTPTVTGTYRWRARYEGDANNLGDGPTGCLDAAESVVVVAGLVTPTLTTTASASVAAGGQVHDTAVLSGGVAPVGTIGFQLFGPNDATCTGPPVTTSPVTVLGNGTYVSPGITVNTPGTYRFVATYSGDIANNPVTTACADPTEAVVVTPGGSTTTSSTSTTVPGSSTSSSTTVPGSSTSSSSTVPGSSTSSSSTVPGSSTSSSSTVPGSSTSSSSTVPGSSTSSSSTVPGSSTSSSSSTAPSSTSSTSSTSTSSTSTTSSSVPTGTTTSSSTSSSSTSSSVPTSPSTTTGPTVPPGQPTIDATLRTIVAGLQDTVFGSGFPAHTLIDILLFSSPVLLDTVITDASGSFTVTVTIPVDTEPGTHHLVGAVRGGGPRAETTITVLAPPAGSAKATPLRAQGQLSRTGSDSTGSTRVAATLVVIGLLLVGGAGVGSFRGNGGRRRSSVQQPRAG
jgi:hypothetical protein